MAAIKAGALGYMLKSTSGEGLLHAVRSIAAGRAALPSPLIPVLARAVRDSSRQRRVPVPGSGGTVVLTAREHEVLELMRQDSTTAQMAKRLHISDITVRRHVSSIVQKLGAPDRRAAVTLLEQAQPARLSA